LAITAGQLRAGRALLRWSQADLGAKSGVSAATIKRLEGMEGELEGHSSTLKALEAAIRAAGIDFIPENGGGAGVRPAKPAG
jgi:transcriptional regulator with XRE-family HTH domain